MANILGGILFLPLPGNYRLPGDKLLRLRHNSFGPLISQTEFLCIAFTVEG